MSELFPELLPELPFQPSEPAVDAPLAERMRPRTLEQFVGQQHLVGPGAVMRKLIERGKPMSLLFWGDPGTGKTTLARLLAHAFDREFVQMSAVQVGLAEVRTVIAHARLLAGKGRGLVLFLDEIHRFNKAQQDALLPAVEEGSVVLIGATTENPSFEVNGALLSRCRVLRFYPLNQNDLEILLDRVLTDKMLSERTIELDDDAREALLDLAGGDARVFLNTVELAVELTAASQPKADHLRITRDLVATAALERSAKYDKKGEQHYDIISAFIKSLRGSDPDAAVYYMARMLAGGEDPLFIARRMIVLASEDIGNAQPLALLVATTAFDAVHRIGMPEARIVLAQAATYLASCPKSNASYASIEAASAEVAESGDLPVPLHLRNAPTKLMKQMGYHKGYQYDHDFGGFSGQHHLPEGITDKVFYFPKDVGNEAKIAERLHSLWPERYPPNADNPTDDKDKK